MRQFASATSSFVSGMWRLASATKSYANATHGSKCSTSLSARLISRSKTRNLPAERRLWRIREIVHKIAYETAVPDEKLTTSPKVLRYIRAGAIVIVVLPFVLLIMPFLAACGWYDRARQSFTAKPDR